MVLLFVLLATKVLHPDHIREKSEFCWTIWRCFCARLCQPFEIQRRADAESASDSADLHLYHTAGLSGHRPCRSADHAAFCKRKEGLGNDSGHDNISTVRHRSVHCHISSGALGSDKKPVLLWPILFLISTALCIAVLCLFQIPYEDFSKGGDIINMMLGPVTAVLALGILQPVCSFKSNISCRFFWDAPPAA